MCNLLAGAAGCELPTVDYSSDAASQLSCAVLCVECEKEEQKRGQKLWHSGAAEGARLSV